MNPKKRRKPIPVAENKANNNAFITWNNEDPQSVTKANNEIAKAYASIQPIVRSTASTNDTSISVRTGGFGRNEYDIFHTDAQIPKRRVDILDASLQIYKRIGPVRTIVDTMCDFIVDGIKISHRNSSINELHQNWWAKVGGWDRSHHFVRSLYVLGVAVAKRNVAKLSERVITDLERGIAADSDVYDTRPIPMPKHPKYVLPWSYDFLNPRSVDAIGSDLALFLGDKVYSVNIPQELLSLVKNPKTDSDRAILSNVPEYILEAIRKGQTSLQLDPNRVSIHHYKKNDWELWATPLLYSVFDDVMMLQKLKLADLVALDGAASKVRIWRLGSLDHKILPNEEAFRMFSDLLINAGNGRILDVMWTPDVDLIETKSDLADILGPEKYEPVMAAIYNGLGIPPALMNMGGSGGGLSSASLSFKSLIKRLNYGRQELVNFWNAELKLVQQAFNLRYPASIEFKHEVLTDEAAFNSLLIDLLDRDVISVERVREHLGYIPEVEDAIVKYEWKSRQNKKTPPKASPFHDAEKEHGMDKIFANSGAYAPSQFGVELQPKKPGEKAPGDMKPVPTTNTTSPAKPSERKGQQGEGRPRNSKDTVPRQTKRVAADQMLSVVLWANAAQQKISDIVNPVYLTMCNRKNVRSLTAKELDNLKDIKFAVLCALKPFDKVTAEGVQEILNSPLTQHTVAEEFCKVKINDFITKNSVTPSAEELKQIQSYAYAFYKGEENA